MLEKSCEKAEQLTVQAHIVEGEDSGPAGGSRAVEGHVQNAVRGLNAVLLQGGEKTSDLDVSAVRFHSFIFLPQKDKVFKHSLKDQQVW